MSTTQYDQHIRVKLLFPIFLPQCGRPAFQCAGNICRGSVLNMLVSIDLLAHPEGMHNPLDHRTLHVALHVFFTGRLLENSRPQRCKSRLETHQKNSREMFILSCPVVNSCDDDLFGRSSFYHHKCPDKMDKWREILEFVCVRVCVCTVRSTDVMH